MAGCAQLGATHVHVVPFGPDPVAAVADIGRYVVPALARL